MHAGRSLGKLWSCRGGKDFVSVRHEPFLAERESSALMQSAIAESEPIVRTTLSAMMRADDGYSRRVLLSVVCSMV